MPDEHDIVDYIDEDETIDAWSQVNRPLYVPTVTKIRDFQDPEVLGFVSFETASGEILKQVKTYLTAINREVKEDYYASLLGPWGRTTQEMEDAIVSSRAMLEIEVDLEAGINEPYLEHTWQRATKLLRELADLFWQTNGESIPTPSIAPATEGSIDLFWELASLTLLINIPSDPSKDVTFFGRRLENSKISGVLDRKDTQPRHLTGWLSGHELL